ncbi:MAG TPA: hypothetical protein DCW68_00680 [Rhodospirillaceae bacterium]|nr:MAG: hypothetical protein A2018_00925 [Alphaproteobacteria bacterium GWF2_58_20]HAU28616.1 hypothetical protein [Rhodospirillaceae bacterium]
MTDFAKVIDKAYGVEDRAGKAFLARMREQLRAEREWTYQHCLRVGEMARQFALSIGVSELAAENLGLVVSCHDIGKLSVPAELLDKVGECTPKERAMRRDHSRQGGAMLEGHLSAPLLKLAAGVAENHHEKWDGTGYRHKAGKEIPVGAQIAALCDVFDASVSDRHYHVGAPVINALSSIAGAKRNCFNPELLKPFILYGVTANRNRLTGKDIARLMDQLEEGKNGPAGTGPVASGPRGSAPRA